MDEGEVKPTDAKAVAPEKPASHWRDPTVVALFTVAGSILTAVLAFGSNIYVTNEINKNALVVERFKAQSTIILQAIRTGSEIDACKNLVVFVKLGLVDDGNHTIKNACSTDDTQKPIEGASAFYDPQRVTVTSNDGSFSLPTPPINVYDVHFGPAYVRVEKDGYVPVTVPMWVSAKNTVIPLQRSPK